MVVPQDQVVYETVYDTQCGPGPDDSDADAVQNRVSDTRAR